MQVLVTLFALLALGCSSMTSRSRTTDSSLPSAAMAPADEADLVARTLNAADDHCRRQPACTFDDYARLDPRGAGSVRRAGLVPVWSADFQRLETAVDYDVAVLIGGNASPDHLGPDEYDALVARMNARPQLYAAILEHRFVRRSPGHAFLASMHVPSMLMHVERSAPGIGAAVARRIVPIYEAAASSPPADAVEGDGRRLAARLDELRSLARQ